MDEFRGRAGSIGFLLLCLFLLFYGVSILVGLAIPAWVGAILAILAGLLMLVGR